MLQQIINTDGLIEDNLEGIATILNRDLTPQEKAFCTTSDYTDMVTEAMFKGQSEILHIIANDIKKGNINGNV